MVDEALLQWRQGKDAAFAQEGQSPLDPEAISQFEGLRYYDANPALRFAVTISPYDQIHSVEMETSTGQPATYERYGQVAFSVDGHAVALTVFRDPQQAGWFLPFRDATSGGETYGAGRYVELEEEGGGFVLDFNYAYNPFCAYSPHWVCPVPPAENRLAVTIAAGEKTYS
jgi:uncharacterized protein (DUF1684 family)